MEFCRAELIYVQSIRPIWIEDQYLKRFQPTYQLFTNCLIFMNNKPFSFVHLIIKLIGQWGSTHPRFIHYGLKENENKFQHSIIFHFHLLFITTEKLIRALSSFKFHSKKSSFFNGKKAYVISRWITLSRHICKCLMRNPVRNSTKFKNFSNV